MADSNPIDESSTYADVLILLDACIIQACSQSALHNKCMPDYTNDTTHSREVELNEPVANSSEPQDYRICVLESEVKVNRQSSEICDRSLSINNITFVTDKDGGVLVNDENESSIQPSMRVINETETESNHLNLTETDSIDIVYFGDMPKKPKNSLQEAFLHFRKKRQDEIKQERRRRDAVLRANADPKRMEALRIKIIAQAKKYYGVPYKRKYWTPSTPEYQSPIFLDCCGLVRQVIRDLEPELGFRLGPWNQSYMYDTLPVTLKKEQMKPGDLVFMRGIYTSPRTKKQRHNMTHVEIWLGDGDKTIGSRWNKGKVGEFESYKFSPKSFHSEEYIFKSIDTWLMGICHSYCSKHPWRVSKYNPTCKSIFNVANEKDKKVEKEEPDTEDEGVDDGDDDDDVSVDKDQEDKDEDQIKIKNDNGGGDVENIKKYNDGNKEKCNNSNNKNIVLDPAMGSLKINKKGGASTPVSDTGGTTPRSRATESPRSNPRTPRSKSNKKRPSAKQVKPAQDAYVIQTDVRKTGPTPHVSTVASKYKKQDLGRMASHALKRRVNQKSKQEDSSATVTPTPIPIVGNCNTDELNYIPANMPSRAAASSSNSSHWVPTKDRERKMKKERESAFVHPNQKTATWNLHHSEKNPIFSVVGSKDSNMPKVSSCPNLEQSDVNLLFRANTSFFDAGAPAGKDKQALNAMNKKREVAGINKSTKQIDKVQNNERLSGSLDVSRARRADQQVGDCLIVRKSPSFVKDTDKTKGEEDRGTEGGRQATSPLTSTTVLQEIKKRHSVEQTRHNGNFSQIQEEESLIAEADMQSMQNSDVKKCETKPTSVGIEREACIDELTIQGRESSLKGIDTELRSLCFSEEVIQDTARSMSEMETADDCITSLCSDFEIEYDEDGYLIDVSENYSAKTSISKSKHDIQNNDCNNTKDNEEKHKYLSDSDENTDDEFQSAMEMTVLNHRALNASTAVFVGEGYRHSNAWEWLHALKAGEHITPDDQLFNLETNSNKNSDYIEYCHNREANCHQDKFLESMRDTPNSKSLAYRKHNTLPPINTTQQLSAEIGQTHLNHPTNPEVLQDKNDRENQDAYSMDVALPQTRQTGLRPSLQAANTFYEGFQSKSKANNLLAHYVLSQHPNYADDASPSEGGSILQDDYSYQTTEGSNTPDNRGVISNPSMFESSASCHSLSSEEMHSLQRMISRQQNPSTDLTGSHNPTRFYTNSPGASSTVQEDDQNFHTTEEQEVGSVSTYQNPRAEIPGGINNSGKRPSTTGTDRTKVDTATANSNTSSESKEPAPSVGSSNGNTSLKDNNNATKSAKGGDDRGGGGDDAPKGKQPVTGGGNTGAGDAAGVGNSGSVGGGGGGGGAGGGTGGNRKPVGGRPSKLPSCSLPNNMQPTFYIGGGNGTALVEGPLLNLGWKRITDKYDERYRLKWVECKSKINYAAFKEGEQLVNHIPNCKLLTNKLGLLSSLQEYERVTLLTKGRFPRMKMADFVPETYKLDERNDREKFLNEYQDGEVWICKPTGLNQGKGIFLLRSRAEIDQLLLERDAKNQSNKGSRPPMMRIVQRYIKNPLLLDGRKFDIRTYMLIASTVPYLLLYSKGYVRLSVIKYDNEDTNLTAHLTNQYIQKKDPSYKDVKEDSAWSMDKFNDYINENFASEHGLETDWVYGSLTKQMQRIILHCFNGVKHKLQSKIGYFDLYGMDFMVDTDFKVWLIEINVNPALHTNCEALKEIIPDVVEETLHLSIECFDKSRKGQPLMPLNSLRSFNVLYCGTSPNTVAPRQTRSVSPSKDGVEKNRPSGTAPSVRRASPPRNLPRMSINNTQMTTNQQPPSNTANTNTTQPSPYASKRASVSSTLPTINIGATVIQKKSTTGGPTGSTTTTSTSGSVSGGGSGGGGVANTTTSASTNNSGSAKQQQQQQTTTKQSASSEKQPPQSQAQKYVPPQPQIQDIGLALGEDQQTKLRMTHADSNRKKSRDYSSRGN